MYHNVIYLNFSSLTLVVLGNINTRFMCELNFKFIKKCNSECTLIHILIGVNGRIGLLLHMDDNVSAATFKLSFKFCLKHTSKMHFTEDEVITYQLATLSRKHEILFIVFSVFSNFGSLFMKSI